MHPGAVGWGSLGSFGVCRDRHPALQDPGRGRGTAEAWGTAGAGVPPAEGVCMEDTPDPPSPTGSHFPRRDLPIPGLLQLQG